MLQINPEYPQPRRIERAAGVIREGGVIACPTDSVYGIGCDLYNKNAIDRIYQIRNRNRKKPFTFLCSDLSDLAHYANVPNYAYRLMRKLTPGPYTFVLDATRLVPKIMRTNRQTVGIRVPDHHICHELLVTLCQPMISTTARADSVFFSDPYEIREAFGNMLNLIIDAGPVYPQPTTVLDLTGGEPRLIRAGKGRWDE
ncbi:threonylcarbamoyl-AMP synthase [bacterium]|nr:threonylcarbamoyl-AMP synthase [candidate division CSSED10-310 bacterium]